MHEFGVTKPDNPHTLDGIREFYVKAYQCSSFSYCIFASYAINEQMEINIPQHKRKFLMDATFKICPKRLFKQFLVIYIELHEEVFPFIFVLMSRKTQSCYTHLFNCINDNIVSLRCESFITDYESAMRSALRTVLGENLNLYGCWFHYTQAIRRQAGKITDFFSKMRRRANYKKIYYKLLALPLLPHHCIEDAYDDIIMESERQRCKRLFEPLFNYFQRQWLNRVNIIYSINFN